MTALSTTLHHEGDRAVVTVSGELDLGSAGTLREAVERTLDDEGCASVQIDLAGLAFIDSSGLGLLVELRRAAAEHNIGFDLVNVPPGPARIISISGLAETFGLRTVQQGDND